MAVAPTDTVTAGWVLDVASRLNPGKGQKGKGKSMTYAAITIATEDSAARFFAAGGNSNSKEAKNLLQRMAALQVGTTVAIKLSVPAERTLSQSRYRKFTICIYDFRICSAGFLNMPSTRTMMSLLAPVLEKSALTSNTVVNFMEVAGLDLDSFCLMSGSFLIISITGHATPQYSKAGSTYISCVLKDPRGETRKMSFFQNLDKFKTEIPCAAVADNPVVVRFQNIRVNRGKGDYSDAILLSAYDRTEWRVEGTTEAEFMAGGRGGAGPSTATAVNSESDFLAGFS